MQAMQDLNMQRDMGWGRKAVERFKVDKKSQLEALRQIGIDVALYEELEQKAALQAEIRKATLQQEQSSEGKYFRYMKPGKQITAKEKELKSKISAITTLVKEQRIIVNKLAEKLKKCQEETDQNWSQTNEGVRSCFEEADRLEKNGPRLADNGNTLVYSEHLSLEKLKARTTKDIEVLRSECAELDNKISNQRTHVEYIRNYERLGLPRDLRKIDQLNDELGFLKTKEKSMHTAETSPEIESLKSDLKQHALSMGNYYAKAAMKNKVPTGLLELVQTNEALQKEKLFLIGERERMKHEIQELESSIRELPVREKTLIVESTLYPKFSAEKIFPVRRRAISATLPASCFS